MAKKKIEDPAVEHKFSKDRIVMAKRYSKYRDFLQGNLQDGQEFSFTDVDQILSKFFERKGD